MFRGKDYCHENRSWTVSTNDLEKIYPLLHILFHSLKYKLLFKYLFKHTYKQEF